MRGKRLRTQGEQKKEPGDRERARPCPSKSIGALLAAPSLVSISLKTVRAVFLFLSQGDMRLSLFSQKKLEPPCLRWEPNTMN